MFDALTYGKSKMNARLGDIEKCRQYKDFSRFVNNQGILISVNMSLTGENSEAWKIAERDKGILQVFMEFLQLPV
jgi:hypothetical protein